MHIKIVETLHKHGEKLTRETNYYNIFRFAWSSAKMDYLALVYFVLWLIDI